MQNKTIAVIGGDKRFERVVERFRQTHKVYVAALNCPFKTCDTLQFTDIPTAIESADCVVLPCPVSRDGILLNLPVEQDPILLETLFSYLHTGQLVFGGGFSDALKGRINARGAVAVDILKDECMTIQNAVATAEGALAVILNERDRTLYQSRCLITGFGRIAKILSRYLQALGGTVTVCARKPHDRTWAQVQGYHALSFCELPHTVHDFDVIINTVPTLIFDSKTLANIDPACLLVDLASKPGGVDFKAAGGFGIRAIHALSLPGKAAPMSAGDYIYQSILTTISERGL